MFTSAITPLASASRTSSGVGAALDLGVYRTAHLTLDVTAVSGTTPTLLVTIETAPSSIESTWLSLGAFAAAVAVGRQTRIRFTGADQFARVRWTISGSAPSFAFSVTGLKVLVYADPADIRALTLPAGTLVDAYGAPYTDSALGAFCETATDDIDDIFGTRFSLPLTAWGSSTRRRAAELAAFYSVRKRGFNPEDTGSAQIVAMKDDAVGWLTMAQRHEITPVGVVDATPDIEDGGAEVVTNPRRGWGFR